MHVLHYVQSTYEHYLVPTRAEENVCCCFTYYNVVHRANGFISLPCFSALVSEVHESNQKKKK